MATAHAVEQSDDPTKERLLNSTPYWCEKVAKIVDKRGRLIDFNLKPGQVALDEKLEAQKAAGKPMRAIILKARQLGFSTYVQAKLAHRCTLREHYDAVVVAHDKETGAKLFRMFDTIYRNLPEDPWLKPASNSYRRSAFLHLTGEASGFQGAQFPDSRYTVDTAGEFQAGRGGTYRAIHGSEVAMWPQIGEKLTALMSAVPDDPETLFVMESTAKGYNEFKDWWDDAEREESDWIPFFWPWWKEDEYRLPFASETERERFVVGDPANRFAEEEPELVEHLGLDEEQLHWRRRKLANTGGDIKRFQQEFPATPGEAFIATGGKVFDNYRTAQILVRCEISDPRVPTEENPGPVIGDLYPTATHTETTRSGGQIEVPTAAQWKPRERGVPNPEAPWRFWLEGDRDGELLRPSSYVIGVDVSGGRTETTKDPDYHVIQVLDHRALCQVAEYRSRIDPDLLARQILLAGLFFGEAEVAIERTGSWGMAPLRILYHDFHYPFVYRSRKVGAVGEKIDARLGWDTNVRTKPLLVAGMAELIRSGEDGVRSRVLADEIRTYTRTEKGTMEAEPGNYDDSLMAYMIAMHVARETPLRDDTGRDDGSWSGFVAASGIGAYDSRY